MVRLGVVARAVVAVVDGVARRVVSGVRGGGANSEADLYGSAGEDAPPLEGDFVAIIQGPGNGARFTLGSMDPRNEPQAAPGERRTYGRSPDGVIVGTIWIKGDGSLVIEATRAIHVDAPEVLMGDGGRPVACAGDLVAVTVPLLSNSGGPCIPANLAQQTATGYVAIGKIMQGQSTTKA